MHSSATHRGRANLFRRSVKFLLVGAAMAAVAHAATPRDAALAGLNSARAIYEKVCEASPQPRATVLPAAVEVRLSRLLVFTSDLLAKGDDKDLMTALIAYTAVSDCSTDNDRALALARIFRARPDPLNGAIAALTPPARCHVVGQLQWGWSNDFLPTPTAQGVSAEREDRLTKLKQSVPAACLRPSS